MNRYGKYQETENVPAVKEHKDYGTNIFKCQELIKNTLGKLPKGMKIYVQESLLYICWIAPILSNSGNFIRPIFLHQGSSDFSKEVEYSLNLIIGTANRVLQSFGKEYEVDADNMLVNAFEGQETQYFNFRKVNRHTGNYDRMKVA